ncbi:MAG: GAF domain-containing protein [Planctomycetia bacterium]|nr:GAF domain-containing protein [Planctomycetia bacterium]
MTEMADTRRTSDEGRVHELERLLEVARHLGATVELDPLLLAIASAATGVLDCERATVFLHDRDAGELRSRLATGANQSTIEEIRIPVTRGIAGEVARTGVPVNIPDAYADPRFNADVDRATGFRTRSMLTIPLADHDGVTVGVLQLLNKRGGAFTPRDEELATFLAGQAGVALQRQTLLGHLVAKQRIERDLDIARTIQLALLPREPPRLAGFDIAGWNRPADATGHGIGPALVISEMRALFRGVALRTHALDRAVGDVNDLLCADLLEGRFVTAFFGVVGPRDGGIEFLSAGQGPLLTFTAADGGVRELPTQGLPLGIVPGFDYSPCASHRLAAGDMLVLLTDGFYEWEAADGLPYGTERVAEVIRRHRDAPAAELIERLVADVEAFAAGTRQADDLTAVVLRRTHA